MKEIDMKIIKTTYVLQINNHGVSWSDINPPHNTRDELNDHKEWVLPQWMNKKCLIHKFRTIKRTTIVTEDVIEYI